jgi:hypothetical protein
MQANHVASAGVSDNVERIRCLAMERKSLGRDCQELIMGHSSYTVACKQELAATGDTCTGTLAAESCTGTARTVAAWWDVVDQPTTVQRHRAPVAATAAHLQLLELETRGCQRVSIRNGFTLGAIPFIITDANLLDPDVTRALLRDALLAKYGDDLIHYSSSKELASATGRVLVFRQTLAHV